MSNSRREARRQKTVYWPFIKADVNGNPIVGNPIEIMTRWEFNKRGTRNPQETSVQYDATVDVDREIRDGSQLWLGAINDLPGNPSPLFTTKMFESVPSIKGNKPDMSVKAIRK